MIPPPDYIISVCLAWFVVATWIVPRATARPREGHPTTDRRTP